MKKSRVIVAMSGGVDSSVSAYLLKKSGYDVIGITMHLIPSLNSTKIGGCCNLYDVEDARKIANELDVPHYVLNLSMAFEEKVINDFISQYESGRTPNPCIRCNQYIKFSELFKKADMLDAEYIATGHYAKIIHENNTFFLKKGADNNKDQSYVLYMLSQKQLKHLLFPLGDLTKTGVRAIAKKCGFHLHDKKDSQEICFIPDNDYQAFVKNILKEKIKTGPILNREGKKIGIHKGIAFYTVGQRKNLGISSAKPLYVISINPKDNSIVVGNNNDLYSDGLIAADVNSIVENIEEYDIINVKIRYMASDVPAKLMFMKDGRAKVLFKQPQRAVAPGQAVVFYHKDIVLGGGTIESAIMSS